MRRALLRGVTLVAALALVAGRPAPASGEEIEGVEFAPTAQVGEQTLQLHAVALLRYMVVFKAYVAGLYLGEGVRPTEVLDDAPKRLEIHYFYAISKADFARSTAEGIRRNLPQEQYEALRPEIDRFNALYEDVEPGDRYALNYAPGLGTELLLNDRSLGTIEGPQFARAIFSVWFGPSAIDASLKKTLLRER